MTVAETNVLNWYEQYARPFLAQHAPEKLPSLDADRNRVLRAKDTSNEVTVCFLGNSGVGKSTLLNAIAADQAQVLPAGGIGPLTAQATEVGYSEQPMFTVVYHPRNKLWQTAFALERRLISIKRREEKATQVEGLEDDFGGELTQQERQEVFEQIEEGGGVHTAEPVEAVTDALEGAIKQANNIVCADQFAEKSLEYLVDALRMACGLELKWGAQLEEPDVERMMRVKKIMARDKEGRKHHRVAKFGQDREFMKDLQDHAAGFLSPLIEKIQVGWPSDVLRDGVKLVDLPGIGIAQDAYREVTNSYVKERARAVIVVVDRAGPTEATMDLLRTSGYWERLVGAADDPSSDPCSMLIVVTKVDDVANTERANLVANLVPGEPKPKKRDVYMSLVDEFKPRMRAQISEQLKKIGDSQNASVQDARNQAREELLRTLEIHPVSAPEFRRILLDDEDDAPFLSQVDDTGIPNLRQSLKDLANSERESLALKLLEIEKRLCSSAKSEIELIEASWREENRAAEEAELLQSRLNEVITPKKEEYRARGAQFREFLQETVSAKIEALVGEAREEAEKDVNRYLRRLQNAHWATLRAAVRRGGAFHGSMHINLPDDIAGYFQEPMAAVWGQKLLRDIRRRTTQLASDIDEMVAEVCRWAKEEAGVSINQRLLDAQQERVEALAQQMKAVGKEAVDEMRETVKNELSKNIRKPIQKSCEKFVENGDDVGAGVKYRILNLFNQLAHDATVAARAPTIHILTRKAAAVREEIQQAFQNGGDPLQDTADVIVRRHESKVKRSDAQKRKAILEGATHALESCPVLN